MQTQVARGPHTAALSAASAAVQHRIAMETPLLRLMNRHYCPLLGPAGTLKLLSEAYPGAARLGGPEAALSREKVRAHAMPFDDELCTAPRARSRVVSAVVVAALVGVVGVPSVPIVTLDGAGEHIQEAIAFWQITPTLVFVFTKVFRQKSRSRSRASLYRKTTRVWTFRT